jgi:hypothetical protein
MPNNKHGAIVADPRSLIRHRYSLIPRRTFPVRKIQFPVPAPREFPDSTLKVRVFFRFDHRFVRQIQRNSLFFPCKQGNPLGAGFAADWSLRQFLAGRTFSARRRGAGTLRNRAVRARTSGLRTRQSRLRAFSLGLFSLDLWTEPAPVRNSMPLKRRIKTRPPCRGS